MTQKRNSRSSVVSVMEEENLDLLDFDADKDDSSVDYIETDLGTDNIEDIIETSKLSGVKSEDFFMMDSSDSDSDSDLILPIFFNLGLIFSCFFSSFSSSFCFNVWDLLVFNFYVT